MLIASEIISAYEGKKFVPDKVRKVAMGTQVGATFSNRRIAQKYGHMVGITDELYEKWWDDDDNVSIVMEFDDPTLTIKKIEFFKDQFITIGDKQYKKIVKEPTQEDLQVFKNILEFITTE